MNNDAPIPTKPAPEDELVENGEEYLEEFMLMDVSCDKRWVAYLTHRKYTSTKAYVKHGDRKKLFLSRRKYVKRDQFPNQTKKNNVTLRDACLNITKVIKEDRPNFHCKFLSISPDGKYVAISFYEKDPEDGILKNPHCLIFEADSESYFVLFRKIKWNGRAVFFNQNQGYSLALISPGVLEVYDNFPNNTKLPSYLFDSRKLELHIKEGLNEDKIYIDTASWFDTDGRVVTSEVQQMLLITRHIRHNVLVTHFFTRGIVRIWSIEDGVRLTSFVAPDQHILAFSKNYKYTAAYNSSERSVNVYNVKSGLLVYQLKSSLTTEEVKDITVYHIRFCYDGRYISVSGTEGDSVFFEVWYVEAEKLVYRKTVNTFEKIPPCKVSHDDQVIPNSSKFVRPFVMRVNDDNQNKYLKGVYTSFENNTFTVNELKLDIDIPGDQVDDVLKINWVTKNPSSKLADYEIITGPKRLQHLKCGDFKINEKTFLILFGRHMVQIWEMASGSIEQESENDQLVYIRAYKGPDYGVCYSFRENWRIQQFESIKFIGGISSGRAIVNITENTKQGSESQHYHTEELFFPIDELRLGVVAENESNTTNDSPINKKFDYHKLESACQALHYLAGIKKSKRESEIVDNKKFKVYTYIYI